MQTFKSIPIKMFGVISLIVSICFSAIFIVGSIYIYKELDIFDRISLPFVILVSPIVVYFACLAFLLLAHSIIYHIAEWIVNWENKIEK